MTAISVFIFGLISAMVGSIWTTVAAFRVGPRWGFGVLFAGLIVCPIFLYKHWAKAWPPVLLTISGVVASFIAVHSIK